MTKEIPITKEKVALVDDEDFELLSRYKWYCQGMPGGDKAARHPLGNNKRSTILMHRVIMGAPDNVFVDHINHNTLDNRRSNLRICTNSENQHNRVRSINNTSGYKGVTWNKKTQKWLSRVHLNGICHVLGSFDDIKDAARAYDKFAKESFGEFALLNF